MDPSDDVLAAIVDHLGVGVVACDPDGRIILWNAEAARLTGRSRDSVIGADVRSLGAGVDVLSLRSVLVPGADGRVRAVVRAFSDPADGDPREETLAMLDGLFENAPLGFTYVDTDLRYRRVNASVVALNGGSVEDRIGRTIDEVHGEPCGPQFSAVCRDVIRTGRPRQVRIEGRLWHGTGPHQVWRMNYYPVLGRDGQVVGVGDVFVDITDAERVSRDLAEQSRAREYALTRYQSLIDATSAAVWIRDTQGRAADDSPTFRAITGQGAADYLAGGHLDVVHPGDRADAERTWLTAVRSGRPYQQTSRLRTASGEFRHFRTRAVPVRVDGRIVEWIGTETDIDAEVRARTRLELLAQATAAVNRELEPERELQALAEVLVPAFADACTVHLLDPLVAGGPVTGRRLVRRFELDVPVAEEEPLRFSDDHPFVELCRTGQAMLLEHPLASGLRWSQDAELTRWERELGWHSTLLAPIRSGSTVVAALGCMGWGDRPRYTSDDVVFVADLSSRASAAVEHARRFQETRLAALTLQQAMLSPPPSRADVAVEARYQPAMDDLEVGGDWYDAFTLPGGDLGLVVGDVVGHDLEAATVMGQLRSMFRGVAMDDALAPSMAVARLDELLAALGITTFTTLLYGRLRTGGGGAEFTWCSAGHVPPITVGPDGGFRVLDGGAGLVLGVDARCARTDRTARLAPGGTLLLCTDGLVERRHGHLDEGMAALGSLAGELAWRPLAEFCDELLTRTGGDSDDDVVVLAARPR